VIGAERGLDPELEAGCDRRLRINTAEPVESLNTAVAAALSLFEVRRR
jgi:tRNA G18 (ribose-2'-O)-methylase SpoU